MQKYLGTLTLVLICIQTAIAADEKPGRYFIESDF